MLCISFLSQAHGLDFDRQIAICDFRVSGSNTAFLSSIQMANHYYYSHVIFYLRGVGKYNLGGRSIHVRIQ